MIENWSKRIFSLAGEISDYFYTVRKINRVFAIAYTKKKNIPLSMEQELW